MADRQQKTYKKIRELSKHARLLQGISSLLQWDQETYMPDGAARIRAEQVEAMAGLIHRERTGRKFSRALSALIDLSTGEVAGELSSEQVAALKEWRRDYLQAKALPAKFVEKFAKLTAEALIVWRESKKTGAFPLFSPFLEKIVAMAREQADLLGYAEHPYDALLNLYEPDMTTKEIELLFSRLRRGLTPLIKKIADRPPIDNRFLFGEWEKEKQLAFSWRLLDAIGYEREKGRLDLSAHPFSSASHPTDSRITTRLHPRSLMSNIFAVLHEVGHALYEMGLPQEEYGTPLGDARSLGVHESQSKWWETRIGGSRPFWEHFFPLLQETFKGQLDHISLDLFYGAIHKVAPSFIRIEADELTYPLHVVLRFELERQLIDGSLRPREVPDAWNAQMEALLGIVPKNDAEGCLQDIHWAMGSFGYFPSYTLGNLYAAHLFEGFAKEHPEWETRIAGGQLSFVRQWLHDKVYRHGRRYATQELLQRATGKPFSADPYLGYLNDKYTHLTS